MKTEWKVLFLLAVLLLCMEAGVRVFETQLSKDLTHLRELPAAAQRLKGSDAYKILIVGNSLARYGIDQELLADELENKRKGEVQVEGFYPDGTSVTEWNYGMRRYFLNRGAIPDEIIVITGRMHLLDTMTAPERLGAFYVDRRDVNEAVQMDLESIERVSRFFLARGSSLFANRSRIQPFVFYNYLPEYTQTIQEINDQRKMKAGLSLSESGLRSQTTNLARLLKTAQEKGVVVNVLAIPMRSPYEVPDSVRMELKHHKVAFWDLSDIGGIDEGNFFDGYHLDNRGARRVTVEIEENFLFNGL